MKCASPYVAKGIDARTGRERRYFKCGRCMPCRINKRRFWTGRIVLENRFSEHQGTFLTLTYDEEHLENKFSLEKEDLTTFVNRLRNRQNVRKWFKDKSFRFFAVGEYGSKSWRPHFHIAIFGLPPWSFHEDISSAWGQGFFHTGELNHETAQYIAGYATKKLTKHDDPRIRDTGLHPEFTRMSRSPPIGARGIEHIASLYETRQGAAAIADRGDVPNSFRIDGKEYPIGDYWIKWLRNRVGINDPPSNVIYEHQFDEEDLSYEKAKKQDEKIRRRSEEKARTI